MKTFYSVLRAFYAILLFGLVFGTISCADKINTPSSSGAYTGMIIYTKYDNSFLGSMPNAIVIDTSGNPQYSITDAASPSNLCDAEGGKILYAIGVSDPTQNTMKLIAANNDNSEQHVIYAATGTQDLELLSPVLSPDGSYVAYATIDSGATTSNLWVEKSDGTSKRLITSTFNNQSRPCFSEDGKYIVYYTLTNINQFLGQCTIEIASIGGTGINTVCSISNAGVDGEGRISWRHGTNEIAFTDQEEIFMIQVSGGNKMRIDSGATPMWSPDGTQLAYSGLAFSSTNGDIMVTSDFGLTKTNLTNTASTFEAFPQWSADGKHILCMSWVGDFDKTPQSLKLINVSSPQESKIVTTPGMFGYFLK